MQTILYFVVMFTISVANDVDVYVYTTIYNYYKHHETVQRPRLLFTFEYHVSDMLNVKMYLKNKPMNVTTDVNIKYVQGVTSQKWPICIERKSNCEIKKQLKEKEILIELALYSKKDNCTKKQTIIQGTRVSPSSERINNTPNNDICLTSGSCVIEVDLRNTSVCGNGVLEETTTNKTSGSDDKSSEKHTWIYVISSLIGMFVIILTIYLSVKKYCRQNSRPVETMEFNTYATVNEVVYADLSLAHGDSQPPRREESPYAQIVGLMRPVDGNVKKK